jgi:hypothetical protein
MANPLKDSSTSKHKKGEQITFVLDVYSSGIDICQMRLVRVLEQGRVFVRQIC